MSSRSDALLYHRPSGQYVPATLIDGVSRREVVDSESKWRPLIRNAISSNIKTPGFQVPQHAHWDWVEYHDKAKVHDLLVYQIMGIECGGDMQGLMLIKNAGVYCQIPSQKGLGMVYIIFLESAPWNVPSIVKEPIYRHVGSTLLAAAIDVSEQCEFKGRIGLHALPQADSYYSNRCNMTDLGPDAKKSNLRYFEMTAQQAKQFRS